jgi:DNA repair exonuclease SbcCD ATPase subunit
MSRATSAELDSPPLIAISRGGGEKTILLVLIRTILIKQVTNLDFLLIDEPLEHLDSRNRRSLLNCLYGITEAQIIPQVVITTFEDTLTRRFYDQKGVT